VPRGLAIFGLVGGPFIITSGILVLFNVIEGGGPVQGLMRIPEAFWELSLGLYLAVKGFRPSSPVLRDLGAQSAPVA
jgi:hypothetical protein